MTRRERLENKLARRLEWAETANRKSEAAFKRSCDLLDPIPFGQPNVNGRLTGVLNKGRAAMDKSCEESRKAEYHEDKAAGLQRQLDSTIFSDDVDAVERLEKKIADLEKFQALMKEGNKIIRNRKTTNEAKAAALRELFPHMDETQISELITPPEHLAYLGPGFPSFELSNNNANIRRLKIRLEEVKKRQARTAAAEQTENGVTAEQRSGGWYVITFAEFPGRPIINDLKSSGFYWRNGSWWGNEQNTPESVKALI